MSTKKIVFTSGDIHGNSILNRLRHLSGERSCPDKIIELTLVRGKIRFKTLRGSLDSVGRIAS